MSWYRRGYYSGYSNDRITMTSYNDYKSDASKYKAMCVRLGDYKLFFSYKILIAFETPSDQYITTDKHSQTTGGHKWSATNRYKDVHYVEQNILELIAMTTLQKLPFEEAKYIAGIRCKQVSNT